MPFDRLSQRLKGLEDASSKGYPIRNLYRLMSQKEIWQEAYANIYSNKGALTEGVDDNTLDGMSHQRIDKLILALKEKTYKPKPVRRTYIPKGNGKLRPLSIPTGDDKLVMEVTRILLERIYEPIFSQSSHGFRPRRSCHTALSCIQKTWTGVKWFVKIDIKGFFSNMNHGMMVRLLKRKIDDRRFIKLISSMLKAGYLKDWKYHNTYSGVPQGGGVSPILSNIYLSELDRFIKELSQQFNRGKSRPVNPQYKKLSNQKYHLRKRMDTEGKSRELVTQLLMTDRKSKELPYGDPYSDEFKRLMYCRFADDFLLGVIGSKQEAREIKDSVTTFLSEKLSLQVATDKMRIESATDEIQFLSYSIKTWGREKMKKEKRGSRYITRRTTAAGIHLMVPSHKVIHFCHKYGYGDWYRTKPRHRAELLNGSDVEIISIYNAELRGLANYYQLADDVKRKLARLQYLSNYSLFKTLATKHKTKKTTILKRLRHRNEFLHRYKVGSSGKTIQVFQLKHMKKVAKTWEIDSIPNTLHLTAASSELIYRLNTGGCEYCGREDLKREVHHVRKLKDLKEKTNRKFWQQVMIARNRKTIILCTECHDLLHAGKLPDNRFNHSWGTSNTIWASRCTYFVVT